MDLMDTFQAAGDAEGWGKRCVNVEVDRRLHESASQPAKQSEREAVTTTAANNTSPRRY